MEALEDLKDEDYVVNMGSLGTMGLAGVRLVGAGFPKDFERLDPQTVKIELSTIEQVKWAFYGTSHPLLENGRAWVKAGWKRY